MQTEHTFGYLKNGKIFRKGFLCFDDREIGEIRENEENSFKYFEDRFIQAKRKVQELIEMIEKSQNKGSFLMKLIHMKDHLHEVDALGDFEVLYKKLADYEIYLNGLIEQNRKRNLEIKTALLQEARAFESSVDWKDTTEKLMEIKQRWIRTGAVPQEEKENLEKEFEGIYTRFFARKKEFFEDRQRMFEARKAQYERLIEEMKALKFESLLQVKNAVRELKNRWKNCDPIPKSLYAGLKHDFDGALEQKQKEIKLAQQQMIQKGEKLTEYTIASRKKLIEELEKLHQDYVHTSFRQMKEILERWKNEGPVPKQLRYEMNERFFELYDLIGEKKFVHKLARNKYEDFDQKPVIDQLKIKMNILKDLLYRDQQELDTAMENVDKFNSDSEGFKKLIQGKLDKGRRKIEIKRKILNEYKKQIPS